MSQRANRPEILDDPDVPGPVLRRCLEDMATVNALSGGRAASLAGLLRLIPADFSGTLRLLDVGTASGAFIEDLVEADALSHLAIETTGIDILDIGISMARRRSRRKPELNFEKQSLFDLDGDACFDVVHASLFLHHFYGDEAVAAIDKMLQLSRYGVVINDLHRHPVSYVGSKVLLPLVTRNEVVLNDGPLSVLRGFHRGELLEIAEDTSAESGDVTWHFPFRWSLTLGNTS